MEADRRKNKGLGRWSFLENGPDNSGSPRRPPPSLWKSTCCPRRIPRPHRRQRLHGLRQELQATFPANSAKPTSKLPQRPCVTVSEKSAPRRDHLVDSAPSAEPETLSPSQRLKPLPTETARSLRVAAAARGRQKGQQPQIGKVQLFIPETCILSYLQQSALTAKKKFKSSGRSQAA